MLRDHMSMPSVLCNDGCRVCILEFNGFLIMLMLCGAYVLGFGESISMTGTCFGHQAL